MADRTSAAADARRRKKASPPTIQDLLLSKQQTYEDLHTVGISGWWRDAELLSRLGPALASLFPEGGPSVVVAPQSRGTLVGALVAHHIGVGLVEVRKDAEPQADSDQWLFRTTPPDYRDRHLRLGFRKRLLLSNERVLFVDDCIDTGGQAAAVWNLVQDAGATWIGAAVVVDGLADPQARRRLNVRSLLRNTQL